MIPSFFSQLLKISTFLAVIAVPFGAQAGDPPTLVDFNNRVLKISNKAVRTALDVAGENNVGCDDMMVAVSNATFSCMREKAKCEPATAKDGTPLVSCAGDTNECEAKAYTVAEEFWKASGTCKEVKVDVAKPGCGNTITEFGEDCDLGELNGTANAACSETCKASAVAAPAEDSKVTVPVAAQPQPGNSATGGSCALHPLGNNGFSFWHLLTLGMGAGLLGIFRRQRN